MRYVSRPVIIEAFQVPARDEDPSQEMVDWLQAMDQKWEGDGEGIVIEGPTGTNTAFPGDWIIKNTNGEYYPCPAAVFAEKYEPVK